MLKKDHEILSKCILEEADGTITDLLVVPPGWVQKLARKATSDWIWSKVAEVPTLFSLASF